MLRSFMQEKDKSQYSVLVVDDDFDVADLLKDALEALSVKVHVVLNGNEALTFLSTATVDCIVTDVVMPNMSGTDLVKKLRALKYQTPFFFMTGYSEYSRVELNEYKPRAIIFKPFDFEDAALLIKSELLKLST
jgi:CheY-like chemotaxis protein